MADEFSFSFEMPARKEDAPKPTVKATRRLEAADGVHWFDVRGGGTQVEGKFLQWVQDVVARPVRQRASARDHLTSTREAYAKGTANLSDVREAEAALAEAEAAIRPSELDYNAYLATFIADRVVDHNLTDEDGEKLPTGLGLFWAMPGEDALRLALRIQSRHSIWADPKAGSDSTNG